jgi:hypothetical protein
MSKNQSSEITRLLLGQFWFLVFYDEMRPGFAFVSDRRIELKICTKARWNTYCQAEANRLAAEYALKAQPRCQCETPAALDGFGELVSVDTAR